MFTACLIVTVLAAVALVALTKPVYAGWTVITERGHAIGRAEADDEHH